MKYLKVRNWDAWQTYRKDRGTPPWIKLYRNILTNPEWAQLTDADKGLLLSIWVEAADKKGRFSNNAKYLQKHCQLDEPPNLDKLMALGFVEPVGRHSGNQTTTKRQPDDTPETETETKNTLVSKADLWKWQELTFKDLWDIYPRKLKRVDAFGYYKKQIKTPADYEKIKNALVKYKADVEHERKNGHADLKWQHGKTWFNKNWLDYVDLKPQSNGQPKQANKDWRNQFPAERIPPEQTKKFIKDFTNKLK